MYCSLVFVEKHINIAELAIGFAFTCPVINFLCNAEVFIVVLYCLLEFVEGVISMAEIAIGTSFTCKTKACKSRP